MSKYLYFFGALFITSLALGQCYEDRHNTSWNEAWVSCQVDENPNPQRGLSHWILYDFGNTYRIANTQIWNINTPEWLDNGFRDFYIDYSVDGLAWQQLGQFTIDRADGTSTYEGASVTSFGGDTVRFVLFTAIDNWGGDCSGFAEVKFEVVEQVRKLHTYVNTDCFEVAIYPNPHRESFNLSIRPVCEGPIIYTIYDHTGKEVSKGLLSDGSATFVKSIDTGSISPGLYHILIRQGESLQRYPLMKIY